MANRRCLNLLTRHCPSLHTFNPLQKLKQSFFGALYTSESLDLSNPPHFLQKFESPDRVRTNLVRCFSSEKGNSKRRSNFVDKDEEGDDDDDDNEEEEGEEDESQDDEDEEGSDGDAESVSNCIVERVDVTEENEKEAAAIGYQVIGPLDPSERPFKRWEPAFAVVQIGSHQFKVCNGDTIYTERLKFCHVNDKLVLNRVLMLGSKTQTIIGRPTLPDAAVHAVVEEHALDAKVIIFKKKRRKNYRRTKGHRQELTRLRITDIQGIEKPQPVVRIEKPQLAKIAA